ncbi:hypothetical protein FSARC_9921 [Fusarium sarcochroum]|uniref:Uncharacterized protein n=1 Tax=Fusarium sarcochroum TaxID=1208366 RepID=A0A8H4X5Q4_9HYPO|nr:hypothetical protein FSARC_9921 [Fusarium sarcochroum]
MIPDQDHTSMDWTYCTSRAYSDTPGNGARLSTPSVIWSAIDESLGQSSHGPHRDAHKERQAGLIIDPARVRLIPKETDEYMWAYTPSDSHLFSRNMGEQSVSSYKELKQKVGKTFFAVARSRFRDALQPQPTPNPTKKDNGVTISSPLSSRIDSQAPDPVIAPDMNSVLLLKEKLVLETTCKEQLQLELANIQSEHEILAQRFKTQAEKTRVHDEFLYRCLHTMSEMTKLAEETKDEYLRSVDVGVFPL